MRTRSQAVSGQCQHQRLSKHAAIGGFPYATPVRHGQECYMRRAKEPAVSKKCFLAGSQITTLHPGRGKTCLSWIHLTRPVLPGSEMGRAAGGERVGT